LEPLKFKRASIFTKIIVVVLLIYAAVTLISLHSRIESAKADAAELARQVDEQTAANAELAYDVEHSNDDDVKEDIARDRLGMVLPGEEIYFDN